jgi:hypothetical protein
MSCRSERMPSKNITSCSLKKTTGIDVGPTPLGEPLSRPRPDEAEIEFGLKVAVEVVPWNEVLQRDGDGVVEATGFGGTEHMDSWVQMDLGKASSLPFVVAQRGAFFNTLSDYG